MKPNRYLRWQTAKRRVAWIKDQIASGKTVQISTYTRATRYKAKHADMFKANATGAYVQAGKRWDCIDFCKIIAY